MYIRDYIILKGFFYSERKLIIIINWNYGEE